jgi:preprotein translocase subunit YajC
MRFKKMTVAVLSGAMTAALLTVTAFADDAAQTQQVSGWQLLGSMWPFAAALVLMYLLMFRPQQKREKQAQQMRENVRVGDEVCTAGGLVGIVIKVTEDTVVLETGGERSKIRVKKWAIHENITQMEEAAAAAKERKAKRAAGIATAAAEDESSSKKKKNDD